MLDHSNLEDYEDPILYDAQNDDFGADGSFYLALAQKVGGPVLELGCGTGRITIPLAQEGIEMTGLDLAPSMLARAQQKAGDLPIRWVEGNMRSFQLDGKFRLICATGGAFQLLLARPDQEQALARVREHLLPDGYFALDMPVPRSSWLRTVDQEQEWGTVTDEEGQIQESGTEEYDALTQVKHETVHRQWQDASGQVIKRRVRFAFRYLFPQEMEALLHYNGFKVVGCYGGAAFTPATRESGTLFYVCQATRS